MTVKITDTTIRDGLLALIASAGLAMAVLAFLPWINFHTPLPDCPNCGSGVYFRDVHLAGIDAAGLTSLGDGYLVAGIGIVMALCAAALFRLRQRSLVLMPAIVLAGVVAAAVSIYDLDKTDWVVNLGSTPPPTGTWYPRLFYIEQHATPILYSELTLGVLTAVCALLLLGRHMVTARSDRGTKRDEVREAWA